MRSNYRPIGDYIERLSIKNTENLYSNLLGINIDKYFMPSVANVVGTDLSKYKIVRPYQFACNRMHVGRDYRLPIALSKETEPFLVSPAYDVFEIIDKTELIPEYLMMWFSRAEFDRNSWFYTDTDVRGKLGWDSLCEMQLPVPSLEKQQEIVNEYKVITDRIQLNEQLNQKLEETAQALYKHWFVDFEFPNENGRPYACSGGAMVYNEELDKEIPEGWEPATLEDICVIEDGDRGKNYPNLAEFSENSYCLFLNAGNVTKTGFEFNNTIFITKEKDEQLRKGKLKRKDIVLTTRGTVGNIAYYSDKLNFENVRINSGMVILRNNQSSLFLYTKMKSTEMKDLIQNHLSGSAQPQLPITDIKRMQFPIPNEDSIVVNLFNTKMIPLQNSIEDNNLECRFLKQLQTLLLSKMATVDKELELTT